MYWYFFRVEHSSSHKKPAQMKEPSTPQPAEKCNDNCWNLFFQRAHCAFVMFLECTIRGKMPSSEMAIKRVASDGTIDFLDLCFLFQMYYGIENLKCSICSTISYQFFLQIPPNSFRKKWGHFLGGKSLEQHLKCLHDFFHIPSGSKPRWPTSPLHLSFLSKKASRIGEDMNIGKVLLLSASMTFPQSIRFKAALTTTKPFTFSTLREK